MKPSGRFGVQRDLAVRRRVLLAFVSRLMNTCGSSGRPAPPACRSDVDRQPLTSRFMIGLSSRPGRKQLITGSDVRSRRGALPTAKIEQVVDDAQQRSHRPARSPAVPAAGATWPEIRFEQR